MGDPLGAESGAKEEGEELAAADEGGDLLLRDGLSREDGVQEVFVDKGQLIVQLGLGLLFKEAYAEGGRK